MKATLNHKSIVSTILGMAAKPMFIYKPMAKELLLRYDAMINVVSANEVLTKEHIERTKEKTSISFYSSNSNILKVTKSGRFSDVEKGSVAVVPVMGAMMRDDYCTLADGNIAGTRTLEKVINQLDTNDNVDGIVLHVNTPGGEAFGNESLSRCIRKSETPIVVFYEMMASAGVFSFQAADEIYAAEKNSMWGSIGTFITLMDDSKFWEEMGVSFKEIYATQSTEKNLEFREALKNDNDEPLIGFLDNLNSTFINEVKKSRPQIKNDGSVFKGKLYNAVEAKKIGAIDGIRDLDHAISRARTLSRKRKKSKKYKSQNQSYMGAEEKQLNWFQKMFGADATAEDADKKLEAANKAVAEMQQSNNSLEAKNKELLQQLETLTAVSNEQKTTIESISKENESLNEKVSTLEGDLRASNEKVVAFEKQVEELTTQNEQLIKHNQELGGTGDAATPVDKENQITAKSDKVDLSKSKAYEDVVEKMASMKGKKS